MLCQFDNIMYLSIQTKFSEGTLRTELLQLPVGAVVLFTLSQ